MRRAKPIFHRYRLTKVHIAHNELAKPFYRSTMPIVVSNRHAALLPSPQQRLIIELIEETLLKRIEVLCELNGLQTSRDFLHSSLHELVVAIDDQCTASFEIPRQYKNAQYVTTNANWQDCQDSGILFDSSHSPTNDDLYPIPQFDQTPFSLLFGTAVQEAYIKYKNDCTHIKEKEEAFKCQISCLSNLEFKLHDTLKAFGKTLQDLEVSQQPGLDMVGKENDSVLSIATEDSAQDVPPLLEEYYSCKGDVGIYQERLQELAFHHEDGLIERDLLKERVHILDVSDGDYVCDYQRRRLAIESDLSAALAAAKSLAERCRAEGISIPKGLDESEACLSAESDVSHVPVEEPVPHSSPASKVMRWLQKVVGRPNDSN